MKGCLPGRASSDSVLRPKHHHIPLYPIRVRASTKEGAGALLRVVYTTHHGKDEQGTTHSGPGRSRVKRERVLASIESVISPYIGGTMARASTKVHCEKLGLLAEDISMQECEALVQLLARALRVFVGEEKASSMTNAIMKNLKEEA